MENRNGLALAIGPVARRTSPKGPYSYWAEVVPSAALTSATTFPLPSNATKCAPWVESLTASSPPTPPAPCTVPLRSNPQRNDWSGRLWIEDSNQVPFVIDEQVGVLRDVAAGSVGRDDLLDPPPPVIIGEIQPPAAADGTLARLVMLVRRFSASQL